MESDSDRQHRFHWKTVDASARQIPTATPMDRPTLQPKTDHAVNDNTVCAGISHVPWPKTETNKQYIGNRMGSQWISVVESAKYLGNCPWRQAKPIPNAQKTIAIITPAR